MSARWTAEAGYYYYTTETYRDNQGKTQTRQVRNVRWEPASGSLEHFFDDELVAASMRVAAKHLRRVRRSRRRSWSRTTPASWRGGWSSATQIDLVAAAQHSRAVTDAKLRDLCAARVPGDTQRNLHVDADYSAQTLKHILVPIWLLT